MCLGRKSQNLDNPILTGVFHEKKKNLSVTSTYNATVLFVWIFYRLDPLRE